MSNKNSEAEKVSWKSKLSGRGTDPERNWNEASALVVNVRGPAMLHIRALLLRLSSYIDASNPISERMVPLSAFLLSFIPAI